MALAFTPTAGRKLRASELLEMVNQINSLTAPGWTSYTPTWTASSVNPAIGNGTITGRSRRAANADLIVAEIRIVMGSTTTYGTGFWGLSLPANANATSALTSSGIAYFYDTGTLTRTGGVRFASASQINLDHPTLGVVAATVPHTWANTDVLQVQVTYQPA